MSGFIYCWRDRKNNRYYIGSHWGSPEDGYVCSSKWMNRSYKNRPEDFKRRILSYHLNRSELLQEESRWLKLIPDHEIGTRYYNLSKGDTGHWSAGPNLKTIGQKISKARKGKPISPEGRENVRKAAQRRIGLPGPSAGTKWTDEQKSAHSERLRRVWAEGSRGKPETLEKLRKRKAEWWSRNPGFVAGMVGKKHSEETKAKISQKSKEGQLKRWASIRAASGKVGS